MPNFLLRFLLLLAAVLIALLPASLPARELTPPADGTPIAEVRIVGIQRVTPAEILRRMELQEGGQFTEAAYRRDIQSIANIGTVNMLESTVTWETRDDGQLVITVSVVENPVIASIQIIGNSRFKREELLVELDYEIGDLAPTDIEAATARNLRSFYREGGYKATFIDVVALPQEEDPGQVDVIITIDEGKRIKIDKVIYIGKTAFSDFHLNQRLANAPGIFFFSNYFDEHMLGEDAATIRGIYQEAGYLDAEVRVGDLIYDEDKTEIVVTYEITEGPKYRVGDVRAEGVTYFTAGEIERFARVLPDREFKGRRLAKVLDDIRRLYGDQGYIDTEVGYRLDKHPEQRTADIIISIAEAPVVYVGEIILDMEDYQYDTDVTAFDRFLEGFAPPTKPESVRREVRLEPGEKYRTADEVRTVERLKNLGIFRRVEVEDLPTTDPQVRDARITVEEDPAAAFIGISAGVGEKSGPAVTVRFDQPNAGGRADVFTASATIGLSNQAFLLRYFDRYIGESDTSADYRLYYSADRYRAYRERTLGGSVEFGRPLDERLNGYLQFRFERVSYSNYDDDADEEFNPYYVAAVRPMLVYDRRDNVKYPTRGYLVSGGIETGYADGFLFKVLHTYEWYKKPFYRYNTVYAYQHSVGLMPYDAREVGLGERFFLGGSSNLRGFRPREVGERDPGDDELAIGGATRITQRHELRFPIKEEFLYGRVFTDIGILERRPFMVDTPRIGSGVGATIDFGPLEADVDLAVPVLRESTDKPQYFHLRLGSNY